MKRKLKKLWQLWLRVSIPLNIFAFIIALCCVDSEKFYIPLTVALISGAWLILLAVANDDGGRNRYEDDYIEDDDKKL